jgi:hypothetical protein
MVRQRVLFCSWLPMTHGRLMPTFSVIRLAMFCARSRSCLRITGWTTARRGVFVRAEEVAFLEVVWRVDVDAETRLSRGPLLAWL